MGILCRRLQSYQHVTAVRADKGSQDGGNDAQSKSRILKGIGHAKNASAQGSLQQMR